MYSLKFKEMRDIIFTPFKGKKSEFEIFYLEKVMTLNRKRIIMGLLCMVLTVLQSIVYLMLDHDITGTNFLRGLDFILIIYILLLVVVPQELFGPPKVWKLLFWSIFGFSFSLRVFEIFYNHFFIQDKLL